MKKKNNVLNYPRIAARIYNTPWAIGEAQWNNIHNIFQGHIKGASNIKADMMDLDASTLDPGSAYDVVGSTAIVSLTGIIGKNLSMIETACGGCDIDDFITRVESAYNDTNVENILLDINSPGGEITGVPEAAEYLRELADGKQIISFSDGLMCSAAYWLACSTDGIYCTKTATLGSIGVYIGLYDFSLAYANEGIKPVLIKAGQYKGDGMEGLPITQDTIARLQLDVNQINDMFRTAVTSARNISNDFMQGQGIMGINAVSAGLADYTVSDINDLIAILNG